MSKKKCKHNRLREKFIKKKKTGFFYQYCTQCQKWVNITITQADVDKDTKEFKERWKK